MMWNAAVARAQIEHFFAGFEPAQREHFFDDDLRSRIVGRELFRRLVLREYDCGNDDRESGDIAHHDTIVDFRYAIGSRGDGGGFRAERLPSSATASARFPRSQLLRGEASGHRGSGEIHERRFETGACQTIYDQAADAFRKLERLADWERVCAELHEELTARRIGDQSFEARGEHRLGRNPGGAVGWAIHPVLTSRSTNRAQRISSTLHSDKANGG